MSASSPFDTIMAAHLPLFARLTAGEEVSKVRINDMIRSALDLSHEITALEDRKELACLLRFWTSYLMEQGERIPDIDIDKPERRPKQITSRSSKEMAGCIIDNLNEIEGKIKNLKSVIIVSIKPIVPGANDALRQSMISNIGKRATKYLFLFSQSVNYNELSELKQGFQNLEKEALVKLKYRVPRKKDSPEEYISLFNLPCSWDELPPYIFYDTCTQSGEQCIIGLRGTEKGVSIASRYVVLAQDEACTLFQMILNEAPHPLDDYIVSPGNYIVSPGNFAGNLAKVIPFPPKKGRNQRSAMHC